MSYLEKLGFLKGLAKGLNLSDSKEAQVIAAMIDLLDELTDQVQSLTEIADEMGDDIDDLQDSLEDIEEEVDELSEQIEAINDELDEALDQEFGEEGEYIHETTCPNCGEDVSLTDADIDACFLICPHCKQKLAIDTDCGDGCGCGHDHDDE